MNNSHGLNNEENMASGLREKTISGMLWNAMERFGSSLFLFISNLVLARLLSPNDFGAIAMLRVFISLSEAIVDAGFGNALIQKQDVDQRDCSTIFVWNICFAAILYALLFFSAPAIAGFYKISILKDVLRVQGLVVLLNSLVLVHIALLKKQLNFKKMAKISLLAIIFGTLAGIIAAFYGAGVWSLVLKLLLTAIVQVFCYYGIKCWTPSLTFDYFRFKSMFRFGGFIFVTRMLNTIYCNILSLIIGKCFNVATLGYYNQARKLEDIPRSTLASVVTNVTFSAFSQINNDIPRLREAASKCMRSMSFIAVPLTFGAIVVAKPLLVVLFTTKWIQSVSYFQVLCFGGIVMTPLELNAEILNAIGKSNIAFKIRLIQRLAGICLIAMGIRFGMEGLLAAYVIGHYLCFVFAGVYTGKYIGYGLLMQVKDLLPFVLVSIVSAVIAFIPLRVATSVDDFWMFLLQTLLFVTVYFGISLFLRFKEMSTYIEIIKRRIMKK